MLKNRSVSLLLLILCAGLVLGMLLNNTFTLKTVEAQQNQKAKWEYCRVSEYVKNYDKSGQVVFSAYIEYYQQTGIKREESGSEATSSLSQVFANLGEQGWEMQALESKVNGHPEYYFKRLKQ
jgi:hypothetical protein